MDSNSRAQAMTDLKITPFTGTLDIGSTVTGPGGYKATIVAPVVTHLTIPEVLAALRLSRATYYRLVRAGKIHPRQISPGRVLIPRSDVDAILSGN